MAQQLKEFLDTPVEAQPYLIGRGVLPVGGKMVLAGSPKSNKSWIVLNLMLDLAMGRPAFSAFYKDGTPVLPIYKPTRVLYMEQEMGQVGLAERFLGREGKRGLLTDMEHLDDLPVFIKTRDTAMRLDLPEGRDFINQEISSVKPDVVVMDPMAQFHLADENDAQDMSMILRVCNHIIEDHGCSVLLVHHTGKESFDNPRRGIERLRGSSAISGDIDTYVEVRRISHEHALEPVLALDFILRRAEPLEELFVERKRDGHIEWLPEYQFDKVGETEKFSRPKAKYRAL